MKNVRILVITLSLAASGSVIPQPAHVPPAPFGLRWGIGANALPEPSERSSSGNIKLFTYRSLDDFHDIEEVTLKVCDREGLQQAISTSRMLTGDDARRHFASMYSEGERRYGEKADIGDPTSGTASWANARVTMFVRLIEPGFYRIYIVQDGPAFLECTKTRKRGSPSFRLGTIGALPS